MQIISLAQRHGRRRLGQGRAAHVAFGFTGSNQSPAVATDAGTAGVIYWGVRQGDELSADLAALHRLAFTLRNLRHVWITLQFPNSPSRPTKSSACSSSTARMPSSMRREVESSVPKYLIISR